MAPQKKQKKGQNLNWIMPTIVALIVLAVGIVAMVFSQAIGGKMVGQIQASNVQNYTEWNITRDNIDMLQSASKWNPTITLVLIAGLLMSLIFSVLLGVFIGRKNR